MEFVKQTRDDRKKAVIALMFKIAAADGNIDEGEEYFIVSTSQKFGLLKDELAAIKLNPDNYELMVPESEFERVTIFYNILFLIKFDKIVTNKEIEWVNKLGAKFGFNPDMVTEYIDLVKQYESDKMIPADAMLSIIKKYKGQL